MKLVFTWSENPYSDMWSHLMFLSKTKNAKNLLLGKLQSNRKIIYKDGTELDRKANQLSLGITQAWEYFRAADSVSIATSPLLYFYGMLSLAKSLIIANKKNLFFEDIKYHGLTQNSKDTTIENYKKNPKNWKMEDEFIEIRSGVAPHLMELIDNFQIPNESIITFKDLLSVCPEIAQLFELYYQEPSNTIYLYYIREDSDPYKLVICPSAKNEVEIFKRIPELAKDFEMRDGYKDNVARVFISKNLAVFPTYFRIYTPPVGGRYIVGALKYRKGTNILSRSIDPIVTDYFALYILSMCVRYKQDFWGNIISGEKDGVIGLVQLYLSIAKRRFPNAILNNLFGWEFSYGAPSRLM